MAIPWWRSAVVYQIYPRSFADADADGVGALPGITRRLEHVRDRGADAVWLSPIYRSPMADFGYDIADHTDVDPIFGSLADADALIARAHELGLRIPGLRPEPHVRPASVVCRVPGQSRLTKARLVRVARRRGGAQQLDVDFRRPAARLDARSRDRRVVPSLVPPRAARPPLG